MILEAEEKKNDKGLNTLKVLQSRPPFTYHMVYKNEIKDPLSLVLMSYLFVPVTSPTPSPTTLYTVTKGFAYGLRQ